MLGHGGKVIRSLTQKLKSKMQYILIQHPGFKEKYFEHLDKFKSQSSEELISIYNQNVRTGIVGVYAQAIMLVALRFEIKRRFGVSPIKLKDNMILSLTGKVKISNGKLISLETNKEIDWKWGF